LHWDRLQANFTSAIDASIMTLLTENMNAAPR